MSFIVTDPGPIPSSILYLSTSIQWGQSGGLSDYSKRDSKPSFSVRGVILSGFY